MSFSEEQAECPLCMEPFDIDDVSFFPCTCGYQICRFCWHRIRTNENGLCPACRKAYPEDPAEFKPLTEDEVHRIKKDRRQKESQRKQKSAECRKHLANVRVVQKNLVFVVGLSPRLCDAETLRRHEYFGKFGKIHKVVINQSTSYVGSQGPSASAYVTYYRPEDAVAAIRTVNNLQIDGRTLKASLGTTKYCSHFLKGTQCQKPDCMYLHDYGDEAASFTKEEIQQGKHLVYEQKLHDKFSAGSLMSSVSPEPVNKAQSRTKDSSPPSSGQLSPIGLSSNPSPPNRSVSPVTASGEVMGFPEHVVHLAHAADAASTLSSSNDSATSGYSSSAGQGPALPFVTPQMPDNLSLFSNYSFATNPHAHLLQTSMQNVTDQPQNIQNVEKVSDTLPASNGGDWQGSLGLSTSDSLSQDDDLGFDPWDVSARALADLIEKEKISSYRPPPPPQQQQQVPPQMPMGVPSNHLNNMHMFHRLKYMPPGFAPNGMTPNMANMRPPSVFPPMALMQQQQQRSRMLNMMQSAAAATQSHAGGGMSLPPGPTRLPPAFQANHAGATLSLFPNNPAESSSGMMSDSGFFPRPPPPSDVFSWRDWQENFKALLPNVNISFGTPPHSSYSSTGSSTHPLGQSNGFLPSQMPGHHGVQHTSSLDKAWSSRSVPNLSWDPAIINTGDVTTTTDGLAEDGPPHWMASLHHLTEDNNHMPGNGSFYAQLPASPQNSWMSQQMPSNPLLPPGFGLSSPVRPRAAAGESQFFGGEHQLSAS